MQKLMDKTVASGGAIEPDAMMSGPGAALSALSIHVDNTLGTVMRDLTLELYGAATDDTPFDTVLLRRVGYGAASASVPFAPGLVRGCVGLRAPALADQVSVLLDFTGEANSQNDKMVFTEGAKGLDIFSYSTAGATPNHSMVTSEYLDTDTSTATRGFWSSAAGATRGLVWGYMSAVGSAGVDGVINSPVPRRIHVRTTAPVAGTIRIIVKAYGPPPGVFSIPIAVPAYFKVKLAQGGSGAARVVVYG